MQSNQWDRESDFLTRKKRCDNWYISWSNGHNSLQGEGDWETDWFVCLFIFHTPPQFSKHLLSPICGNAKMNRAWLLPPRAHVVRPHFVKSALRSCSNPSSTSHPSYASLWALLAFGLPSNLLDVLCSLFHLVLIMIPPVRVVVFLFSGWQFIFNIVMKLAFWSIIFGGSERCVIGMELMQVWGWASAPHKSWKASHRAWHLPGFSWAGRRSLDGPEGRGIPGRWKSSLKI